MKDVAWRMQGGAGDPIAALAPRAIWRIRRAGGAPLDGMHVWAWCWLMQRTEGKPLPCRVEFKAADLAQYFERSSHTSALDWLKVFESVGLVGDVETERGMFGYTRLRMYDVEEVLARGELETRAADPQLELDGIDDEPAAAAVVQFTPPEKCRGDQSYPDISPPTEQAAQGFADATLPERPDVPLSLWTALTVHLGRNAEVYLGRGQARFELSESSDDPHRIYLAGQFLRDYVQRNHLPDIASAFEAAGLDLACGLTLRIDEALTEKCRGSNAHPDITPQQQPVGLVRNPSRVSNQPTNQPSAARAKAEELAPSDGPAHPLLVAAYELYQRIGDTSLWKWVAIAAVLLELDGKITPAEIDGLIAEHRDDFGAELKKLAQSRRAWPKQGALKSRLRAMGIIWKCSWERGANHPRKGHPR